MKSSRLQEAGVEFRKLRVQCGQFQASNQDVAGCGWVDDFVDPESGSAIARVGLLFVGLFYGSKELFLLIITKDLAGALQLLDFDIHQGPGCLITTHHRVARCGPSIDEPRRISLATHGVVPSAEAATEDDR